MKSIPNSFVSELLQSPDHGSYETKDDVKSEQIRVRNIREVSSLENGFPPDGELKKCNFIGVGGTLVVTLL